MVKSRAPGRALLGGLSEMGRRGGMTCEPQVFSRQEGDIVLCEGGAGGGRADEMSGGSGLTKMHPPPKNK